CAQSQWCGARRSFRQLVGDQFPNRQQRDDNEDHIPVEERESRPVKTQPAKVCCPAHDCRSRQRPQTANASQKKAEQEDHGISLPSGTRPENSPSPTPIQGVAPLSRRSQSCGKNEI